MTMKQKSKFNRYKSLFLVLIAFAFGVQKISAQVRVSGTITDTALIPLSGASVTVKGTSIGAVADFDGVYSLSVPEGSNTLVFSYIGYLTQEIEINGKDEINVILTEDAQSLDEIVVIGYGTQRKSDLTGSVGTISGSEFSEKPITSPDQALAGTLPGVNITNRSGDPGAPISVRIRGIGTPGVNDPLWVIDGVPIVQTTNITVNTSSTTDSNPLAGLNPNDIESISVLKDAASTAIYGARAANGVIIVTTKRGKSGEAKVTYDGYTSFASVRDMIDVLDTQQFIDVQGLLGNDFSQFNGSETIDWQSLIFRQGFVQNHNLNVNGGNENANYFISAGYLDQEGIERAQEFSRISFKANSDIKVGAFKFGESLLISQTDRLVQSESAIYAAFNSARNAPFYQPYGDGPLGYNYINPTTVGNANAANYLYRTDEEYTRTTIQTRKVLGNFYGEVNLADGLKAKASLGIDYNVGVGDWFTDDLQSLNGGAGSSLLVSERPIELTLTSSATLQYDKTFKSSHNLGVLFGFEQTKFRYDKLRLQGRNLFNDNFASSGTTVSGGNEADLWALQGWIGRLTYNYKGKYLLTANVRRDATSRFAPGNREQIFPSASIGWRISDEEFFSEDSIFDEIKLRAGWGQSGNQFTGLNFAYIPSIDNNVRYVLGDGQSSITAPAPTTFANSDLKWETSTQFDLGIDFSLLKGKITGVFDYYDKTTDDVLIGVPLPYVSGFFLPTDANIGQIKNSGIEFSFNYSNSFNDFNYSLGGNITTVKNVVTDLGSIPSIISGIGGRSTHRTVVGESLGHFYGYVTDGLYQNEAEVAAAVPDVNGTPSPGDIRFVDINNDGVIDANDRTVLGSPFPGYFYGMSFNADYKGFDFSLNLRGVGDKQIYNSARIALEGMTGNGNFSTQILDRWTSEGTTNSSSNPRLAVGDPNQNNRYSDRWVEDADYLRIQNVSLGYRVSSDKLAKWNNGLVTGMRFYVGVQNLATFTQYSGYDPEVGRTQSFQKGDFTLATGQDGGASPLPRIVQFGWTVNF